LALRKEEELTAQGLENLIHEQKTFKDFVVTIMDSISEYQLQVEAKARKAEILFSQAKEFDHSLYKKKVEIQNLSLIEAAKNWSVVCVLALCCLLIGASCGYFYCKNTFPKNHPIHHKQSN
jgi:hypothetical protein